MTNGTLVRGLILPALAAVTAMAQANGIAKVAYVEGRVLMLRYGSRNPVPAELGATLFPGDQIKTLHGKCQVNFTASGILRLSPNTTVLLPNRAYEDPYQFSVMAKKLGERWVENARQIVGLDPDEVFHVRDPLAGSYNPPTPEIQARVAAEEQRQAAQKRGDILARRPSGSTEDEIVAEYRSLLPTVLQAERKPWHTRFEFIANAVKTGTGYRVAYRTYCLIENGPDKGKDHACYEFDTVLDVGAMKAAVADMKRRLGR